MVNCRANQIRSLCKWAGLRSWALYKEGEGQFLTRRHPGRLTVALLLVGPSLSRDLPRLPSSPLTTHLFGWVNKERTNLPNRSVAGFNFTLSGEGLKRGNAWKTLFLPLLKVFKGYRIYIISSVSRGQCLKVNGKGSNLKTIIINTKSKEIMKWVLLTGYGLRGTWTRREIIPTAGASSCWWPYLTGHTTECLRTATVRRTPAFMDDLAKRLGCRWWPGRGPG